MKIRFSCPGCGASYSVPPSIAGKKADCKKCGLRQNIPNRSPQSTILGDVLQPNEFSHPQQSSHGVESSSETGKVDDSQTAADYPGEYLPPLRSRSKKGQIVFLIVGAMTFVGLGVLVLILILNRGEELKTPVASKKDPRSTANSRPEAQVKNPTAIPVATKPVVDKGPARNDSESGVDAGDAVAGVMSVVLILLLVLGVLATYFLPTIIALVRGHTNVLAVFMMNLLLGWIFIGWAIAMIWACWNKKPEIHRHFHYER